MTTAWLNCLAKLEQELPAQIFTTWIKPLVLVDYSESEHVLRIGAPNRMKLDWVKSQFASRIQKLVTELWGPSTTVQFELTPIAPNQSGPSNNDKINGLSNGVGNQSKPVSANTAGLKPSETTDLAGNEEIDEFLSTGSAPTMQSAPAHQNYSTPIIARHIERAKVNPELSFDSFVTGKANQMARAAAEQVAERPGASYSPLFLYGGVGLGKTHLIHAVGNYVMGLNPNAKVRYIHAEQYVSDVVRAYQRKAFDEFKNYYHSLDLLLIDDIQFFASKSRTQEEFFYAFEALANSRKQIIITSDTYPKDMAGFEERLVSRFSSGLTVAIETPELEMRVAILMKKAEQSGVELPSDVAFFIAKQLRSNVRELEGALKKILAFSKFHNQSITLELVKEALKELLAVSRIQVSVEVIQKTVADYYKMKIADMYSKRRPANIALPRQIAMYIAKDMTQKSLPEIGELFGGRDHTTVLHAVRKITGLRKTSAEINHDLHVLEQTLKG